MFGGERRRPGGRRLAGVLPRRSWSRYFTLEDPRRLEPAERELYVETLLDSRLLLRGFVDRIDVAPDGAIRVVDYKTRQIAPGEMFEAKALFQMRFYALVIWRTRGVVPAMLQLVYLGNGEILRYVPDEARPAGHRAQGRGDLAGDPAWPRRPATGARTGAGCATGAPTRRSARPGAARRRRCPSGADRERSGPELPTRRGRSAVVGQISPRSTPDKGVAEDPAGSPSSTGTWFSTTSTVQPARLGGLGAGVGVLDGEAVLRSRPSAAAAVRYGSGCGLPELHGVAGDDRRGRSPAAGGPGSAPRSVVGHRDQRARHPSLAQLAQQLDARPGATGPPRSTRATTPSSSSLDDLAPASRSMPMCSRM